MIGEGAADAAALRHDGPVHYVESGTGTPLVLLHAFPVDARMWDRARAQLDDGARVITPDQRGLGASPLGGDLSAPSVDVAAADVLELLDEVPDPLEPDDVLVLEVLEDASLDEAVVLAVALPSLPRESVR